jgi:hypothetical protein
MPIVNHCGKRGTVFAMKNGENGDLLPSTFLILVPETGTIYLYRLRLSSHCGANMGPNKQI